MPVGRQNRDTSPGLASKIDKAIKGPPCYGPLAECRSDATIANRSEGLRENGAVRRSATARNRSAATMKELQVDTVPIRLVDERALHFVERRTGREVAAVLHRV